MKWILFSLMLVAAGVLLVREKSIAAALQAEVEQHRLNRAELEAQRRDHARLLAQQPTADELAQLQRAVAERTERRRAIEAAERDRRKAESAVPPIGEWVPTAQWQDRGQGTPMATVQTLLSAAFGGDISRLAGMLHFDEDVRAKLAQIHATLPANTRAAYASPEELMAAFTAKSIPLGEAQVVWQHQSGPDQAVACVWVNNPTPPPVDTLDKPVTDPNAPPMHPPNPKRTQAFLMLRRSDDGWRVSVPIHAVDRLARDLGVSK